MVFGVGEYVAVHFFPEFLQAEQQDIGTVSITLRRPPALPTYFLVDY
jgi:hypothetical protein